MFLTVFRCLSFCRIFLSIFFSYALLLRELFFLSFPSLSFSLLSSQLHNHFQVFIIRFKSHEVSYLPSITYLQINYIPSITYILISDNSLNDAFFFLVVPYLYYVICLLSSQAAKCKGSNQRLK